MTRLPEIAGLAAGLLLAFTGRAEAQMPCPADPMVEASLIADHQSVVPGQTFTAGLRLVMPEGWHTYWRNPGDSGEATQIVWDLPESVSAGAFTWPAPEVFPFGPLANYGYAWDVVLPVELTVAEDARPGPLLISGEARWLVCEDICVPECAQVSAFLEIGDEAAPDRRGAGLIARALEQSPQADETVEAALERAGDEVIVTLTGLDTDAIRNARYFPYSAMVLDHAAAQTVSTEAGGIAIRTAVSGRGTGNENGEGIIAFETRVDGRWVQRAVEIDPRRGQLFEVEGVVAAAPVSLGGLAWSLVLAVLGGLILNLMPCVFPVLSIKALGFVQRAHGHEAELRRHGLIFLAGVLSAFVGLALVLAFVKAAGGTVGWGFQLQSPLIVAILALVMLAIGLNLLGVFEIGTSLQGLGGKWASAEGDAGAFMTGLLAVVVAAPCIGPFAAGALGLALAQPGYFIVAVSAAMGLGLALPYLILSFFPSLLRFLPKPGAWMIRFKQFLAFPMMGAAVWLVWVLSFQAGSAGVLFVLIAALSFGFIVWALKESGVLGKVAAVFGALALIGSLAAVTQADVPSIEQRAQAWSPARVAELRAEGTPIFVEFTAAWCVSCQVNKQVTLNSGAVRQAFERTGVVELVADWTNHDDAIAREIRSHGAAGVPLYVVYPADGGEPVVLPPVISPDMIVEALETAAG
ncbi:MULTISPECIES: protein-disulfide reductase DsbD family protein [Hyphobacterium]|uniref:Protein-disulfide reductase DsbD family protein n=1 Tax=Hyphobacterium vulgare TaxID=1736751 RepID=A0ABV6ZYM7_9PROT